MSGKLHIGRTHPEQRSLLDSTSDGRIHRIVVSEQFSHFPAADLFVQLPTGRQISHLRIPPLPCMFHDRLDDSGGFLERRRGELRAGIVLVTLDDRSQIARRPRPGGDCNGITGQPDESVLKAMKAETNVLGYDPFNEPFSTSLVKSGDEKFDGKWNASIRVGPSSAPHHMEPHRSHAHPVFPRRVSSRRSRRPIRVLWFSMSPTFSVAVVQPTSWVQCLFQISCSTCTSIAGAEAARRGTRPISQPAPSRSSVLSPGAPKTGPTWVPRLSLADQRGS